MSKIFLLKATGYSAIFPGSTMTPMCSKVFKTREAAAAFEPVFREKCVTSTGDDDMFVLEKVTRVAIIEMDMDDEEGPALPPVKFSVQGLRSEEEWGTADW